MRKAEIRAPIVEIRPLHVEISAGYVEIHS